jgi:GNAT superfamily N-acetyltransferase
MTVTVNAVTIDNLADEMEPCLEEISLEKRDEVAGHCQAKRKWFEEANNKYGVCAFVAYLDGRPAGLVEFLPVNAVPYPEERPKDTVFILCSYVRADSQKKGVGKTLFQHLIRFLKTTPLSYLEGRKAVAIEVYVPEVDPSWPPNIRFPTGSKEFYEKLGFRLKKQLSRQKGHLYRLEF